MNEKVYTYIMKTLMSKIRHQCLDSAVDCTGMETELGFREDYPLKMIDLDVVDRIITDAFSEVIDIDDT